jgi:hypothetical protein
MLWRSIHPEDRPFIEDTVQKAMSENAAFEVDYRIVLPAGNVPESKLCMNLPRILRARQPGDPAKAAAVILLRASRSALLHPLRLKARSISSW